MHRAALRGVTVIAADDGEHVARDARRHVAIVDAVRRRDEKLVRPALEPVQRRERRREALRAVAFEDLDTGTDGIRPVGSVELAEVVVEIERQWIARRLLLSG